MLADNLTLVESQIRQMEGKSHTVGEYQDIYVLSELSCRKLIAVYAALMMIGKE